MAKRMLIDAAHPEETRVVVLNGHRLEEFDYETSTKKQIKGNIYLAKVTRVEPSLQAAFVEYGGNRHGFLAFGEIHPDYYRIPVADRRAAIEADRAAEAAEDEIEDRHVEAEAEADAGPDYAAESAPPDTIRAPETDELALDPGAPRDLAENPAVGETIEPASYESAGDAFAEDDVIESAEADHDHDHDVPPDHEHHHDHDLEHHEHDDAHEHEHDHDIEHLAPAEGDSGATDVIEGQPGIAEPAVPIETVGGDEIDETTRRRARPYRHYKIQEVIKRRQIMLVQVTKEERGNKGAALTTYISLAGRYCVLMPNTPRGGGVSRKITSMTDRRRLKELMDDLQVPEGMGIIVRTAGSERSKVEIKRDFEYLLRLWDDIRELTLKSTAPALIYEEGNLIKRSIRDLYARDIDEVLVDGRDGYDTAKSFMRMLMPSHTRRVKFYNDPSVPLFHRFQVEGQLDAIHSPVVQLRSGGYIVINPTEALVAIDVNSGRSTRERNIEETALKTNLEAAEEVARQLRLRDLAGLIVIDFIDMEEHRHNNAVERRVKDAMRHDRARIQLGRISPFGLLELSRQRLRPSLLEASTQPCPHCAGSGHIRSTESTALHVLRAIEEEGMRRRTAEVSVAVPSSVALYILNQKRGALQLIEGRYGFHVTVTEDDVLVPPAFRLDRVRALTPAEIAALPVPQPLPMPVEEEEAIEAEAEEEEALAAGAESAPVSLADALSGGEEEEEEAEGAAWRARADFGAGEQPREERGEGEAGQGEGRGRRRRRRRRRSGERHREDIAAPAPAAEELGAAEVVEEGFAASESEGFAEEASAGAEGAEEFAGGEPSGEGGENGEGGERKRRRRGRRGGRRRRRGGEGHQGEIAPGALAQGEGEAPHIEIEPGAEPLHEQFSYHVTEPAPAPANEATPAYTPPSFAPEHRPERHEEAPVAAAPTPAREEARVHVKDEVAPQPESERAPIAYNVSPTHEVSGPPPNPRRGWWRRLRDS